MKTLLTFTLCLVVGFAPLTASAANYYDVQPGESWYLDEYFENQLVRILGKRNGQIKIGYYEGGTDWVHPSELLTRKESNVDDAVEIGTGLGILTILAICSVNPEACKNSSR